MASAEYKQDIYKRYLLQKSYFQNQCIHDHHLSFKKNNSKKYFFGLIDAYIRDVKAIKLKIFNEMEAWLKTNGFDLGQVYQPIGELPKDME